MFDIDFLKSTDYFSQKTLKKGELLFDEGESDNNLYIIEDGKLSIEKFTTIEKITSKQLAVLRTGDFLGEGALSNSKPKEVHVRAASDTRLLYIDAKNKFNDFLEKYPVEAKNILVSIIGDTNKRVLEANKYITSIYEINVSIRELTVIDFKEIFLILDKINGIMQGDFLLFLETNPVMDKYLTLKYDSRKTGKMQDLVVEKGNYSLEEIGINNLYKIITKDISIGEEVLGHIIIGKKVIFKESEKRLFLGMVNSLAGLLKQKKILEEERDMEFSRA